MGQPPEGVPRRYDPGGVGSYFLWGDSQKGSGPTLGRPFGVNSAARGGGFPAGLWGYGLRTPHGLAFGQKALGGAFWGASPHAQKPMGWAHKNRGLAGRTRHTGGGSVWEFADSKSENDPKFGSGGSVELGVVGGRSAETSNRGWPPFGILRGFSLVFLSLFTLGIPIWWGYLEICTKGFCL